MFKRMIQGLRGHIEFFVYHGREVLVLESLWKEDKRKRPHETPEYRRDRLHRMIDELYQANP